MIGPIQEHDAGLIGLGGGLDSLAMGAGPAVLVQKEWMDPMAGLGQAITQMAKKCRLAAAVVANDGSAVLHPGQPIQQRFPRSPRLQAVFQPLDALDRKWIVPRSHQ